MDYRFPGSGQRSRGGSSDDVEAQLQAVAETSRRWAMRLIPLGVLLLVGVWLMTGIYTVTQGQVGVIRHFGREIGRTGPGLSYRLPWPIQQVDIVNVEGIRRAEIGFRSQGGQVTRVNTEALMLTGDENIVDAQIIVQFRISDASKYLFDLNDPDEVLHSATEVALRNAVGQMKIEDILTTGRAQVQENTRVFLQRLLDSYESGVQVTDVKMQVVDPPEQVKDAFNEVVRAREDREKLINEAQGYREDVLPKARGQAQQILRAAEAYKEQRVIQAQGDVAKFSSVLVEYSKSKQVTRDRLHLEVVERVLSKLDKIIMDSPTAGNILPYLPLRSAEAGRTQQPAQQPSAPAAAPTPAAQR